MLSSYAISVILNIILCLELLVSEYSEWDTIRCNTIENLGFFLFFHVYVWMYICYSCTLTLTFLCSHNCQHGPIPTKQNIFLVTQTHIILLRPCQTLNCHELTIHHTLFAPMHSHISFSRNYLWFLTLPTKTMSSHSWYYLMVDMNSSLHFTCSCICFSHTYF